MLARWEKGLCYNCDKSYSFGHRCKQKQLYRLWHEDNTTSPLQEDSSDQGDPTTEPATIQETPVKVAISLNALSGNTSFQTLKLEGRVKNIIIFMLVDKGSTHNFLDLSTANALGCITIAIGSHSVCCMWWELEL